MCYNIQLAYLGSFINLLFFWMEKTMINFIIGFVVGIIVTIIAIIAYILWASRDERNFCRIATKILEKK